MVRLLIALVIFVAILWVGIVMLRGIGRPRPDPEPGELRRVNLRYKCGICGAEVRMTSAPDEMPAPPRHCLDEMQLVASPYD